MPYEIGFGPRPQKYGGNPEQRIALQPGLDTPINIKIRENLNFGGGYGGDYFSHSSGSNGYDSFDIKFRASVGGGFMTQSNKFDWGMFVGNAFNAIMNVGMFAMMAKWFGGNNAGAGVNPLFNTFGGMTGANYGGVGSSLNNSYVLPFTPTAPSASSVSSPSASSVSSPSASSVSSPSASSVSSPSASSPSGASVVTGDELWTFVNSGSAKGTANNSAAQENISGDVKLGAAQGGNGNDVKKNADGFPASFTIVDNEGHNRGSEYTFEYVGKTSDGKPQYKVKDKTVSDDDTNSGQSKTSLNFNSENIYVIDKIENGRLIMHTDAGVVSYRFN